MFLSSCKLAILQECQMVLLNTLSWPCLTINFLVTAPAHVAVTSATTLWKDHVNYHMTIIYIAISRNTVQSLKIVKNGTVQNEYEMNIHNTANCH